MKVRKIVVSLCAAGLMASPLAHATNGDTMMAVGSQNTALGGTGVAHYTGADSTFANPAMLGKSQGREVTGGLVIFNPSVTNDGMGGTAASSSTNLSVIPDVSYSSRIDDHLSYGVAMAGIAGMGVNYQGAPANTHVMAKTTLSILKVIPTIAYNTESYGLGFSPVLQYGSLAITYNNGAAYNAAHSASTDTNFGYALGGYFNASSAVTLAAAYNSEIKMKYGTQLSGAGRGFGQGTTSPGTSLFPDTLDQPAEVKLGVSMAATDTVTLTADYRQVQWASAGGYKQFGWKNQDILAVGGKYAADGYWLALGYNSANNPIAPFASGAVNVYGHNGGIVNMFNNVLFPATVKDTFTFGGGYTMSSNLELEGSLAFSPKVTTRVDIGDAMGTAPGISFNTTTHTQTAISISARYKF